MLLRPVGVLAIVAASALGGPSEERLLKNTAEAWGVPAAALVVVHAGEPPTYAFWGKRSDGEPVDAETLFCIGSVAKGLVATLSLSCVQEGLLSWDAEVAKYLPDLGLPDPHLRFSDCISHRSGLEAADLVWMADSRLSRAELLARIRHLKQKDDAGSFAYNNLLYLVAASVLERVTEKTLPQTLQQRVLAPLAMNRTTLSSRRAGEDPNRTTPHRIVDGNVIPVAWRSLDSIAPAAGAWSCANDLERWVRWYLERSPPIPGNPNPRDLQKPCTLITNGGTSTDSATWYGRGCFTRSGSVVFHGEVHGWTCLISVVPDDDTAVVVLANYNEPDFGYAVLEGLGGSFATRPGRSRELLRHFKNRCEASRLITKFMRNDATLRMDAARARTYVGRFSDARYGEAVVDWDGAALVWRIGELSGRILLARPSAGVLLMDQDYLEQGNIRFGFTDGGERARTVTFGLRCAEPSTFARCDR